MYFISRLSRCLMACSALGEQECAIIADSRNTTRAYNTYEGLKNKKIYL